MIPKGKWVAPEFPVSIVYLQTLFSLEEWTPLMNTCFKNESPEGPHNTFPYLLFLWREDGMKQGWAWGKAIRVPRADTEGTSLSADAESVFTNRSECLLRFSRAGTLVGLCLAWSKAFCPLSCLLLAPSDVGSQAVWVQSPGLAISLFRCFMCTVRAPHNPQGGLHAARLLLCVLAFSLRCCKLNVYFPFSWAFLTQYSAVLRVRPHFLG